LDSVCFFTREENSITGKHYHTGSNPNKNPEILFLLEGAVEYTWFDQGTEYTIDRLHTSLVHGPARIITKSMVWHQIKTLTRCTFLELNSWDDAEEDTIEVDVDVYSMLYK
jgi:hypothetical protein